METMTNMYNFGGLTAATDLSAGLEESHDSVEEYNAYNTSTDINHNENYKKVKVKELKEMVKDLGFDGYSKKSKKDLYFMAFGVEIDDTVAKSREGYGGRQSKNPKSLYNLRKQAGLDKQYSKGLCERVLEGHPMFTVDINDYDQVQKLKFQDLRDILIYWDIQPESSTDGCLKQIYEKLSVNEPYKDAPRVWNSIYPYKPDFTNYQDWFDNIDDESLKNEEIVRVWSKSGNIDRNFLEKYF